MNVMTSAAARAAAPFRAPGDCPARAVLSNAKSAFSRVVAACLLSGVIAVPEVGHSYAGQRSIVGRWAPDPRNCTPVGGMIGVEPMAMVGDEFRCDFDWVSRSGNTVVWHGSCGFPEPFKRSTVIARTTGEALIVRINGGNNGPYFRCKSTGS